MKINRSSLVEKLRSARESLLDIAREKGKILDILEKARSSLETSNPTDPCLVRLVSERKDWIEKFEQLARDCDTNMWLTQHAIRDCKRQLRVLAPINYSSAYGEDDDFNIDL